MLDSPKIYRPMRRRSRSLAGSVVLVLCVLLIVYTWRPPASRNYGRGPAGRIATLLALSESSNGLTIAKEPEFLDNRLFTDGAGRLGQQAALAPTSSITAAALVIPVVIFAFDRGDNLRRTIESVLSSASYSPTLHPIFISQDGENPDVTDVIESYGEKVHHLRYHWPGKPKKGFKLPPEYLPPPGLQLPPGSAPPALTPYLKIAGHYEFALAEIMDRVEGHERWDRLIMLEDDMDVSPDFFSYFRRMSPLFDSDPSLYCVSAWNDHGQKAFVGNSTALYRTDCFPGLGWMWSRERWNELREWTPGWWDDWLREPAQRKGRSCIYPEVSRAYTFGTIGTSTGWFFAPWLYSMRLNNESVDWDAADVGYLQQSKYDELLKEQLRSAKPVDDVDEAKRAIERDLASRTSSMVDVDERLVEYGDLADLTSLMMIAGLLYEHKAGVPRASYQGVLHFRHRGVRIWLVPEGFDSKLR